MQIERIAEKITSSFLRKSATPLKGVQILLEEYINDAWTTAEESWKKEAIKNAKLVKNEGDKFVVKTTWKQDPERYDESVGEAEFVIIIKEKE